MWANVILIIGAYLLGAIPLQYLLGRLKGFDLRDEYDLHISLWRKVGPAIGLIGILGDFAKGIIAVLVANLLGFEPLIVALTGLAAVIGQMWPVFFKFDEGKGNTTGIAMAGALVPRSTLIFLIPIIIGAAIRTAPRWLKKNQDLSQRLKFAGPASNSLPIGMAIGFAFIPLSTSSLFGTWFEQPIEITLIGVALFALIMIRRATAGVRADFKSGASKLSIVINRLLLDRGFRNAQMATKSPENNTRD